MSHPSPILERAEGRGTPMVLFSIISSLFETPANRLVIGGQPDNQRPPTTYAESPFSGGRDPATNIAWQNDGNAGPAQPPKPLAPPKASHPASILERAEGRGTPMVLFSVIPGHFRTPRPAPVTPPQPLKRRTGRGRPGPVPRPTPESWRRLPPAGRGRPRSASPATFPGFPPLGGRGECSGRP